MIQSAVIDIKLSYPGKDNRRVRVYVPGHTDGQTFPVVYMTDGQNLFDEETSSWGCWHTRESEQSIHREIGKSAVIVGIHNDNPWRDNELTPGSIGEIIGPEEMDGFTAPEGEIFDRFVTETVMPMVEAKFPVKTGRENTAFCGSSSGGLQAFFTVLSHPELFSAAGVFSPALLLYRVEDLRRWINERLEKELPFLYLYTGAGDELEKRICVSVEQTLNILKKCYPKHLIKTVIKPEKKHHESAWEPVFADFLRDFLYGSFENAAMKDSH